MVRIPSRSSSVTVLLALLLLLVAVARTSAECPNGCSGNGACMQKDMCNCYKNYQGNDCADRTCPFDYAHVDTPKGHIDMDQSRSANPAATNGWMLFNSQQSPAGTYEYFNPAAKVSEAHFYMECANKGICDRTTGLCACFDGFEGSACQRTTCPSKCSGHGTCESIRKLGAKAGGTLFGIEHPAGAVTYDLWDANATYGCRCDPWFKGPDCAKRTCKVGVDPLFLAAGTPRYETFVIHAGTTGAVAGSAWIRLRVFDYYGESYITSKIPVLDDATAANKPINALAVTNALKAIPNLMFRDVNCDAVGAGDLIDFKSARDVALLGMSVICQFYDNPGKHRIPEVESFVIDAADSTLAKAFVVTTGVQGENDEWFTKQSTLTAVSVDTAGTALTISATPTDILPAGQALIKIGADILLSLSFTGAVVTLAFPYKKTLGSSTPLFLPDAYLGSTAFTVTALSGTAGVNIPDVAVNVGEDFLTFTAGPPTQFTTGDLLFFHNQFFYVQQIYPDATTATTYYAKLGKPFGGSSFDGGPSTAGDIPYLVAYPTDKTKIYNYVSECSGRGLCSTDTGVCTCFKGYTNDNCNTQNILAL